MDRPIDAAATEQRGIGGIDYGLGRFFGDVRRTIEFNCLFVRENETGCEIGHEGLLALSLVNRDQIILQFAHDLDSRIPAGRFSFAR
jgi:hypothetical protein